MRDFSVSESVLAGSVFVGVDYATAFVQVCVMDRFGRVLSNRRLENDWCRLAAHVALFGDRVEAAIEACNGAADLADELIQRAGWSVSLAHPGYVNRMKQTPDKSDFTDAQMLADLTRVGYLPRVWLAPQNVRELRRLTRHRQDLANRRRAVKLRVGALLREHRIGAAPAGAWTRRWRSWLSLLPLLEQTRWVIEECCSELDLLAQRIARVEARLAQVTQTDAMVLRLCTLRGIGLLTACIIRAEIGDATRFRNGKQLSRFCGLTPRNASSGERQADAGLIQAGNRHLRATLTEAAHRLMRFDPRWKAFAQNLEKRGKKRCVAVAAVANRWVRGLFHTLAQASRAA
jgi:transposase